MTNYTFLSESALTAITDGAVDYHVYSMDNGFHVLVEYPNGYAASITKNMFTSGISDLWEIAILHDDEICRDTPITDDVLPYLNEEMVLVYCEKIRNL